MKNNNKPRVHLLHALVKYQDYIKNGVEFSDNWGAAEVGNQIICWEGLAGGTYRLFKSTRSKATAHFIHLYNHTSRDEYRFSTLRATYQRDYLPGLVDELISLHFSNENSRIVSFRKLTNKPG